MQALKFLVGFMGVVILAGIVVVAVTIYNRTTRLAEPAAFAPDALPIPPGCRIAELAGAGRRLWVRLEGGFDCNLLLVLDGETGALVGKVGPAAGE